MKGTLYGHPINDNILRRLPNGPQAKVILSVANAAVAAHLAAEEFSDMHAARYLTVTAGFAATSAAEAARRFADITRDELDEVCRESGVDADVIFNETEALRRS